MRHAPYCSSFRIEKAPMIEGYAQEIPYDQPAVWMALAGAGRITTADAEPVPSLRATRC